MPLFFTSSAALPTELPVTAMALATSPLVSGERSPISAAERQKKLSCSRRTLWCCEQAPRGWHLFHLLFPWIILLVLCFPCLRAMAENTAKKEADCLQYSFHLYGAHASVGLNFTISSTYAEVSSSEAGLHHFFAQEALSPASCTFSGWSHVWQASFNLCLQSNPSSEIIVQAFSMQEGHASLDVDWGSPRLNSGAFKLLIHTNQGRDTEFIGSRILNSNPQFCAVIFQEEALSPGGRMSILLVYLPDQTGKARGSRVLETRIDSLKVINWGECSSSVTEVNPAFGLFVVSKSKWQEASFLVDSLPEPVTDEEVYVWMEPKICQAKTKEVLRRLMNFVFDSCHDHSLKVTFKADWSVAHSSTQITDVSVNVDGVEHLVGTLCLKIRKHCIQISEALVVCAKMDIDSAELFEKEVLLELENSGCATRLFRAINWQLQASGDFLGSQRLVLLGLAPSQVLSLGCGSFKKIGSQHWINYGGKMLQRLKCGCAVEAFASVQVLRCLKSVTKPAVMLSCSTLFWMLANFVSEDIGEGMYLTKGCAEDSFSQGCFEMFCVPSEVREIAEGFGNPCGPKVTHADESDCRPVLGKSYMAIFPTAAMCTNGRFPRLFYELKNVTVFLALVVPVNLIEPNSKSDVFNLLWRCAGPSIAIGTFSHSCMACKVKNLSTSAMSADVYKNASELYKVAFKHHNHRQGDRGTSFIGQGCFFTSKHQVMPGMLCQIEGGIVNFGDIEFVGLHKGPALPLDQEFENIERRVCEEFNALKNLMADNPPFVCHSSLCFSRYEKFVIKVSLLILCLVFVVLVRLSRRVTFLTTDTSQQHSCTFTVFLHSFHLKAVYMKGAETLSNLTHAHRRLDEIDSMDCPDDSCHEKGLLNALIRAARYVWFILRGVSDSQTTVLNVRVQIAESPCADKTPNFSRNSCLPNDKKCGMGSSSAEKPGNQQTSSCVLAAVDHDVCADWPRLTLFNASMSSLVDVSGVSTDVLRTASSVDGTEDSELNFQVKERKEKGKRRKKRNQMLDLKHEAERMGQSASSSPPSSPASPASPLAHSSGSPFLQSESPSRSIRGASNPGGTRNHAFPEFCFRWSSQNLLSGEMLQLDVPRDHICHESIKTGTGQQRPNVGSRMPSKSSAVRLNSAGEVSVRKNSPKCICATENWAAVARRAIASRNDLHQRQELVSSSSNLIKGSRPVLLPSATFPQRGRSLQWSHQMLESTNFVLPDSIASPSLVSTSLIAPHARAPGSRPSRASSETPLGLNSGWATSQMNSTNMGVDSDQACYAFGNEFLYDIWGDHFAEFSRSSQSKTFAKDANNRQRVDVPVSSIRGSQLASLASVHHTADVAVIPISMQLSADFSIFSHDPFYSPSQQNDQTG